MNTPQKCLRKMDKKSGLSHSKWTYAGVLLLLSACGGPAATGEAAPAANQPVATTGGAAAANQPSASRQVKQAEDLLARGDTAGAKAILDQVLKDNPKDSRAYFDLAVISEANGDEKGAEGAYRQAIAIEPSFGEALNNLGVLLRDKGSFDEAIAILKRAIQTDPRSSVRRENLAMALEDSGDLSGARAAYQEALQLDPRNTMARANFGLLLLRLTEKDAALRELKTALELAANNRPALVAIGNGLRRAGDSKAAVQALQSAIKAANGQPTPALLCELALAQLGTDNRDAALVSLREAVRLEPSYATSYYLLGSMLAASGQRSEATQNYQHYLKLEPHGEHAAQARQRLNALKAR